MYTEQQVANVLSQIGVDVVSETVTNYLALCPIHGNTDTPALSISKTEGVFMCWNDSCGISGTLTDLVRRVTHKDEFQIIRLITKAKSGGGESLTNQVAKNLHETKDLVEFDQKFLDRMRTTLWTPEGKPGVDYMLSRGFTDYTLKDFDIGYSAKRNMIIVPMHSDKGMPLGFIGRKASHTDKTFKNSYKLPARETLWNLHRAKGAAESCIVVESSFDAMRVAQAGFPNVVASLGGYFNDARRAQLDRYFSSIIVMTDDDEMQFRQMCRKCTAKGNKRCVGHLPGEELGITISESLPGKRIRWASASIGARRLYAKDACGMTDEQIRDCINSAVSYIEFRQTSHSVLAS